MTLFRKSAVFVDEGPSGMNNIIGTSRIDTSHHAIGIFRAHMDP